MKMIHGAVCPGFAVCIDHENLANLLENVDKLQDYADAAWTLCGTKGEATAEKKP